VESSQASAVRVDPRLELVCRVAGVEAIEKDSAVAIDCSFEVASADCTLELDDIRGHDVGAQPQNARAYHRASPEVPAEDVECLLQVVASSYFVGVGPEQSPEPFPGDAAFSVDGENREQGQVPPLARPAGERLLSARQRDTTENPESQLHRFADLPGGYSMLTGER
jgi:hypothetical protein